MPRFIEAMRRKRKDRHAPEHLSKLRAQVHRRDAVVAMQGTVGWKELQVEVQAISTAFYSRLVSPETKPGDAEKERLQLMGVHTLEHALSRICAAGDNAEKELKEIDNDKPNRSRGRRDERDRIVFGKSKDQFGVRESASG